MAPTRPSRRRRYVIERLEVDSVNLLKSDNQPKHYTSEYESNELVVRRGFPFNIMLTLSRDMTDNDKVAFDMRFGRAPRLSRGSLIRLPWMDDKSKQDGSESGVKLLNTNGKEMTLQVHTSAKDVGVGRWVLVMTWLYKGRTRSRVRVTNDIIVVFNPWAKADPVYMANSSWRNEYVLNEDGLQYYGTSKHIGDMDWYFGQFEAPVMQACLKLLYMDKLLDREHKDPVMVARHMSGMVNSNDDNGVLEGNWSGDYKGGKSPTYWNGSVAILKQYVETNRPVKYGQCWVFSGVLTSVLRCLGIPARSLTTFESAHDTDGNLTIDYHFDSNGKPLDNDDSIWNFHVWNDAWMTRPRLPEGFGGWQAVDATPQEESQGKFQCGPASVSAIKEGQINYPYDAPFLYAEVNGSKAYWQKVKNPKRGADGKLIEWENVGSDTDTIGQHISTKAVGSDERDDITERYKYPEGSTEERLSFDHARKFVKFTKAERKDVPKVVDINVDAPDSVFIGQDVVITIKIKNISKKSQSVFFAVVGKAVQYNGSIVAQLFDKNVTKQIPASRIEEFVFTLPSRVYLSSVRGNNGIKITFLGSVEGEQQTYASQTVVEFTKPKITMKASDSAKVLRPLKITLSFVNPLSVALTGGEFRIEGAGVKEVAVISVPKVKANDSCSAQVTVLPRKKGRRRIIAGFSSQQLDGLRGSLEISVA